MLQQTQATSPRVAEAAALTRFEQLTSVIGIVFDEDASRFDAGEARGMVLFTPLGDVLAWAFDGKLA